MEKTPFAMMRRKMTMISVAIWLFYPSTRAAQRGTVHPFAQGRPFGPENPSIHAAPLKCAQILGRIAAVDGLSLRDA
jgi:hypothetical protein